MSGKIWKGIEAMEEAKKERRRRLAKLPFEEKIRILMCLQGIKFDPI